LEITYVNFFLIFLILVFLVYINNEQVRLRKLLPFDNSRQSLKRMKILSVVAGHDLDMQEIEKSLYSTDISYNLLSYQAVSQQSLLAELEKDVTVFELSSHGLNGAFRLGNASIPISWLSTALKQTKGLDCALLLYCNSYIDQEVIAASKIFVISMIGDVKDTTCVVFSRNFYFYLNKKFTYTEAFERSRLQLPVEDFPKFIYKDGKL